MAELVEATTSEHASARAAAATCLGQFGRAASEAVSSLVELLRDSEQRVRLGSVKALQRIGPAAEEAVPSLIGFLKSSHLDERAAAAQAISTIGGDAEIVLPALLEALADSENYLPPGSNRDVFLPESFMEPAQITYMNGPIHFVVIALAQFPEHSSRIVPDLKKCCVMTISYCKVSLSELSAG